MLLCTKPFDVLSQPPKPHFSMFIHTYISTHWYTHIQNHTDILQNCLKIRMFTQKFKKTCLLFNLIRCLKNNHLHFNVRNSSKAKKTSRKEKNSLMHSVRKLSCLSQFFNPVLCSFFHYSGCFLAFIHLSMDSRRNQWSSKNSISSTTMRGQNYHTWEFIFNTMFSFATQQTLLFY